MKTNMLKHTGIMLCMVIVTTLSSCVAQRPMAYGQPGPRRMAQPQPQYNGYGDSAQRHLPDMEGMSPDQQQRLRAAAGFAKIIATEKLSPINSTPERLRGLVDSNKRFCRDTDGILSENVTRTVVSGGIIGWSGSDFGFEPQLAEVSGITDRITITDMVNACAKYHKLPYPSKPHWATIRARVQALEASRGHPFRG